MGLMSQILGTTNRKRPEDYVDLDAESLPDAPPTETQLHIADLDGQGTAMEVKDTLADGDIVIADITRINSENGLSHIIDDLERLAREAGGDIVQKGDQQLIITPPGISISREKIGQ